MFRGRYQHAIDPTGRLSVPAKFRDVLAQYDGQLVVVPDGACLEVHPLQEWQRMEAKLRDQSQFSAEVREISRLYFSRAKDVTFAAAGPHEVCCRPTYGERPASRKTSRSSAAGCRSSRSGIARASRNTSGR